MVMNKMTSMFFHSTVSWIYAPMSLTHNSGSNLGSPDAAKNTFEAIAGNIKATEGILDSLEES